MTATARRFFAALFVALSALVLGACRDKTPHERMGAVVVQPGAPKGWPATALAVGNTAVNGPIGGLTAAQSVDNYSSFVLTQTTSGIVATLPTPNNTTAGRDAFVSNSVASGASIVMYGATLSVGSSATFQWDGAAWGNPLAATIYPIAQPTTMILGDSNCVGVNVDNIGNASFGWRGAFWQQLRQWRGDVDNIGTLGGLPSGGPAPILPFHECTSGATIENLTSNLPSYVAAVGVPDITIDALGTNDCVGGESLPTIQAARIAFDAALLANAPNALHVVANILPIIDGSVTHANLASWQPCAAAYRAWLPTYVTRLGPQYVYVDPGGSFGSGDFSTDGLHLSAAGVGKYGVAMATAIDAALGPRRGLTLPQAFVPRVPLGALAVPDAASGANASSLPQLATGAASVAYVMDYFPTSLLVGNNMIFNVGSYSAGFVGIYQSAGGAPNEASIAVFLGTTQVLPSVGAGSFALTLNRWHRIVVIAHAPSLSAGVWVNGTLVDLVTGLSAWNTTAQTVNWAGAGTSFGAPGYHSRLQIFSGSSVPQPGRLAAQLAVEADYYQGATLIPNEMVASWLANTGSAPAEVIYDAGAALTLLGNSSMAAAYPTGATPQRPWEWGQPPILVQGTFADTATTGTTAMTQEQSSAMLITSASSLSNNLVENVPAGLQFAGRTWVAYNNVTANGHTWSVGVAGGTAITIAAGKRAIVMSDGTNMQRVTADQ